MKAPRKAVLVAEILELRRVGSLLSNIAYNYSQQSWVPAGDRKHLDELRKQWDQIPRTVIAKEAKA